MKFLIQIVAIIIAAALLEILLPWWSIAIGAAVGGFFFRSKANFLAGFLAIALLWLVAGISVKLLFNRKHRLRSDGKK